MISSYFCLLPCDIRVYAFTYVLSKEDEEEIWHFLTHG